MELKQCPFCEGESEVCEGGINGKTWVYGLVEHKGGCFFLADGLPTKYQHIMEYDFDAWNSRAERTCTVGDSYWLFDEYTCHLSCGHAITWCRDAAPSYCPVCGAKVVSA